MVPSGCLDKLRMMPCSYGEFSGSKGIAVIKGNSYRMSGNPGEFIEYVDPNFLSISTIGNVARHSANAEDNIGGLVGHGPRQKTAIVDDMGDTLRLQKQLIRLPTRLVIVDS